MGLTYPSSLQTFFLVAEGGFVHVTFGLRLGRNPRRMRLRTADVAYVRGGPVVEGVVDLVFTKDFVGT